jgi:predicted MFS family arabinose efflux permease
MSDIPPANTREFHTGWPILLMALVGITTSAGVMPVYSFGALVLPLEAEFGWSRGELQRAVSSFFVGMVAAAAIAGPLLKYWGLKRAALISLGLTTATFLLLTQISQPWMLYALYFLLPVAGVGILQITWTHLVNLWFVKHRGLALAIVLCGTGLSALLLPLLTGTAISWLGWQGGFVLMAASVGLITLPLCVWFFPDHTRLQHSASQTLLQGVSLGAALRRYNFWAQCVAMALVVTGVLAMITNLSPLLQDRGLSALAANSIFSVVGLALIGGRLLAGVLIDRLWAPAVAFVLLALPALGCLILLSGTTTTTSLMLAAGLIGVGAGAEYDIAAFLVARYFGMRDYSRIFSVHFAVISIGVCLSPLIFGALYDQTRSYQLILQVCAICFALGSLLVLTLGRYPRLDVVPPDALPVTDKQANSR